MNDNEEDIIFYGGMLILFMCIVAVMLWIKNGLIKLP